VGVYPLRPVHVEVRPVEALQSETRARAGS